MLISQKIANLLNGVSQQPKAVRMASQVSIQENALSSISRGLRKRPPTKHVGKLSTSTTGFDTAFVHMVNRTSTERYIVIVANGDLQVFDTITGAAQTVVFPQGKGYLAGGPYKATTVGDYTVLADTAKVVKQGTTKAPDQPYEALVFVRSVDYSTLFSVTLNGVTVSIKTVDAANVSARSLLSTENVAKDILAALGANNQIYADFDNYADGSTIHIKRRDGADFTFSTSDGLSDKGLRPIKGSVQTIQDLPERAPAGFLVNITGDAGSSTDDFWVAYDTSDTPDKTGVWREVAAPGSPLDLDATTMPWALERNGTVAYNLGHNGQPAAPIIADPTTAVTVYGFDTDPDTLVAINPAVDYALSQHNQKAKATIAAFTGSVQTGYIFFDVDTTAMFFGTSVTVAVTTSAAGSTPVKATFSSGKRLGSQTIIIPSRVFSSGATITVTLTYSNGATPALARRANVTLHGNANFSNAGITMISGVSRSMTIQDSYRFSTILDAPQITIPIVYPKGTLVTVVLDGTVTLTYTTTTTKTATALATAVAGVIDAHASYAATASGTVVTVATQTGVAPAPSYVATITISKLTTFWSQSLNTTANSFVGYTINNVTDGSHGIITENGTDYIVVASLTGGTTNKFNEGDLINVAVPTGQFVFQTLPWSVRKAGDSATCPMPSFVGKKLSEVFYYENRLGFTADENIVLSSSGDLFNFFRYTATDLLASDLIDIKSGNKDVALFNTAIEFSDKLYLFSTSGHQYALSGDPILTPASVHLDHKGSYPASSVRPVVLGNRLLFERVVSGFTRVLEGALDQNANLEANDITDGVPQYLVGKPLQTCGDAGSEFMAVLTDGGSQDGLYVWSYHYEGSQKQQASWSHWNFAGAKVVSIDMIDSVLTMIVIRSDGVYLETLDVGVLPAATADHRDRQGSGGTLQPYTMQIQLTPIYFRDNYADNQPITHGRLQLRFMDLIYNDSCDFTVTVTPNGRPTISYPFTSATSAEGKHHVPVQSRNDAVIEITSTAATGCAFSGIDWEGNYDVRSRAVSRAI